MLGTGLMAHPAFDVPAGPARLNFEALSVFLGSDDHLNRLALVAPAVSMRLGRAVASGETSGQICS